MNRIDEMLRDLCPDGVEYRRLGEVGTFIRGNGIQKSDFANEGIACVHYGQIHTRFGIATNRAVTKIAREKAVKLRRVEYGDLMIATTSEDDAAVAKSTAWLGREELVIGGDSYIYRHSLEPKFVAYFFASEAFELQKQKYITGTKVRRISDSSLAKIVIPVPPVEIQRKIVGILDSFTELEAELEARRKQYVFYRDQLLNFESAREAGRTSVLGLPPFEVEWKSMGEVSQISRGASPRPIRNYIVSDGTPWIRIGDVPISGKYVTETEQYVSREGVLKSRRVLPGDFILSNSMSFGRPYISMIEGCVHDGWLVVSGYEELIDRDFLYHLFRSSRVQRYFVQNAGEGTVKNLNSEIVSRLEVPLLPLDVQRRIADVLDSFDVLVNDLSSGLPAEIAARRTQYEYYRDKLLTFPEKK